MLSVLRGKWPHAALGSPPGSEESSSIPSVLTSWSVIGWLDLGLHSDVRTWHVGWWRFEEISWALAQGLLSFVLVPTLNMASELEGSKSCLPLSPPPCEGPSVLPGLRWMNPSCSPWHFFLREEARGPTGGRGLWTGLGFLEINLEVRSSPGFARNS